MEKSTTCSITMYNTMISLNLIKLSSFPDMKKKHLTRILSSGWLYFDCFNKVETLNGLWFNIINLSRLAAT